VIRGWFLSHLTVERLLAMEAFVLIATIALLVPAQNDTWWHLAAGRDMVETGRVALTERWSHTAYGAAWPNYEWLSQVVFYVLYRVGGLPLLTVAAAASIVGAYSLTWLNTRGPLEGRALLLLVTAANATLVWAVRPQVFSLCLVAATLGLVLRRRWLWLPPLFVLWANLHGGVALGGLVLVAALLAAALVERPAAATIASAGFACLVAACLTPLGVWYWPEIVISLGRSSTNAIAEWQPPPLEGPHVIFWSTIVSIPVVGFVFRRRLTSFDTVMPFVAAVLCAALAARSRRNVPVFFLLAIPAASRLLWNGAAPAAAPPGDRRRSAALEPWRHRLHVAILGVTLVVAAAAVAYVWSARPDLLGWRPMSVQAADAIRTCTPPMYNPYNEGGYLAWFVPSQPLFLDSRQDPYPVELVQAHIRAEQQQDYLPLFRRFGIRCAVFPAVSDGPSRLRKDGWRERFRDGQWVVLDPPG
jgi:hypothetical protein